jgi:hypothetical protein
MIKLTDLLNEIEQERREQQLEEGWKENILAAAIAASSIFGSASGQTKTDINFGAVFPSGHYFVKGQSQNTLENKLKEVAETILSSPKSDFNINIISSESQVPNYDAEKPGRVKLDTGELAQNRATVLKVAIDALVKKLKDKGKFEGNTDIKITNLIGKEKWTPGSDKDDEKYTKDQFVKLHIEPTTKETDPYAAYSNMGEIMYKNNRAYAMAFYDTRLSKDKAKGGGLNTGYEPVLLKIVKPDTPLSGKINEPGVYTSEHKIPWDVWNKTVGTSTTITDKMLSDWGINP